MRKTVDILGVPVDFVDMRKAFEIVKSFLNEPQVHTVFTPNAEIMMAAQRDPELKDILKDADLLIADGAGVVLASKILKRNLPEKVAGIDLTRQLIMAAPSLNLSFYFFGGKPGVAEAARDKLCDEVCPIMVAGCRNGYFTKEDEPEIIKSINDSGASILLVALGAPLQEKWIARHKHELNVRVCIGVGGSLDVFAGKAKLAPDFFRKNGLEWLYRLYKEPWRFKRMLDLPRFILLAVRARLFGVPNSSHG